MTNDQEWKSSVFLFARTRHCGLVVYMAFSHEVLARTRLGRTLLGPTFSSDHVTRNTLAARKTRGAIHSTKISRNFGPKLNGSVRSNRKSFEKTGPPFEVDHFSRSDRLEFWLNGLRPRFKKARRYRSVHLAVVLSPTRGFLVSGTCGFLNVVNCYGICSGQFSKF